MGNLAEIMRPKTLSEVIGNEQVVSAISNQIARNELSQTIMFTGEPGTGKTTFAKIIANHLNAEITEIDCGSDGGIETIRELVNSVSLSPLFHSKKVFILDEVHALSKSGQSALLKTLEDSQPNVHFILLTTEPQKILNTIKTRCVEYKTTPSNTKEIGEAVKRIESKYNLKFENRRDLWSVVEQSKGSLRQVYALMEKVVAVAGQDGFVSSEDFGKIIGSSMEKVDENLPLNFLKKDLKSVLSIIDSLKKESANPTGTLIGVYNYLKVVFLKDPEGTAKEKKEMMSMIAEKIAQKEVYWETIESIAWRYL